MEYIGIKGYFTFKQNHKKVDSTDKNNNFGNQLEIYFFNDKGPMQQQVIVLKSLLFHSQYLWSH